MSKLKLFLLGPPRIEHNGLHVGVERRKIIAFLAYLAMTRQPHSRDTLATLLWPDTNQARARSNLRHDISMMNKVLGKEWLAVEGQTVGLQRSMALWVDVEQFHYHLAACQGHGHPEAEVCPACLTPLTEAVTLYQDDFLAGFTLRDSPDFDDWQLFQTESLRRELASALERLVRGHSAQRGFEPGIVYARGWLALDPLHEPAHRALMQLYAWSGQRNAALRQYGECVRILERELGVSPEAATAKLYQAIKENQVTLAAADPYLAYHTEKPARQGRLPIYAPSIVRGEAEPTRLGLPFSSFDRIGRSKLVGRERELAQATAVWSRVVSGEGHVLLVSGEPGVGKTRLAREFVGWVESRGGQTLMGECYAEGGLPYAPIAQMIRATLGSGQASPDLDLPDFVLADLITLTPDLRSRYPNVPLNSPLDPQTEQQRLFESVIAWCAALAARTPLLLFVEDVHWTDNSMLSLLRYLARRSRALPAKLPLLLVMTYREAELDTATGLNELLLDLNRERLATNLPLTRLNREQTHDLLTAMLASGGEISPEFLDGIYRETEGNPFFIEEMCKALIDAGKLYFAGGYWRRMDMAAIDLPHTVKGAILARVEKLAAPVQETLRLAAVLGREFDFDTLQATSEQVPATPSERQTEEMLITALEQAERAQLISEVRRTGRLAFTFAHALIPFTLRESISGLRLQRLHRRVAVVIERLHPDSVEALAYHFAAAGERAKAGAYSRQAARRAEAMYAYEETIQYLQTTLDLIEPGEQTETRLALLEELADVHRLLRKDTRAISLYRAGLDLWSNLAGADTLPIIGVRLHRKILQVIFAMHWHTDFEQFEAVSQAAAGSRAYLEAMLPLGECELPRLEMVHILTSLANDTRIRFPLALDVAERHAQAAVKLAEQLDAPVEMSVALEALAKIYSIRGLLSKELEVSLQRLALSRDPRFGNLGERINVLEGVGIALILAGEYTQALPHILEAESLAVQIGAIDRLVSMLILQSLCWFRLDRWDELFKIDEKRRELEQRYPRERIGATCIEIALSAAALALRGDFDQAKVLREQAYAIMVGRAGGSPENWGRAQHY
jgi:DNA-binding SARP family transcriptional activator